ncbi:MAG: two pore domain potassium channel family protein [Burkholderiales bacterium]|nr:two pore domain potassium channel family protein [Burkholderiales bacterium]
MDEHVKTRREKWRLLHMAPFWPTQTRPHLWLLTALSLTIPAFYLVLTATETGYHYAGRVLYGFAGLLLLLDVQRNFRRSHHPLHAWQRWRPHLFDVLIFAVCVVSAARSDSVWQSQEWFWRLLSCGLVFVRLGQLLVGFVAPKRLTQIMVMAGIMQLLAGAAFLWLEPSVHTFADGMWLAFTTVSTVGYGDIVPTSHAARIFSVFLVLLGYALFSVVTASIAALFIGEDEKRLERELHADIRALRQEVAQLRADLQKDKLPPI